MLRTEETIWMEGKQDSGGDYDGDRLSAAIHNSNDILRLTKVTLRDACSTNPCRS